MWKDNWETDSGRGGGWGEKAGGGKVDIHLMLFESLKRKKKGLREKVNT